MVKTVGALTPLGEWIRSQIVAHPEQRVSFRQFMEWALYHPEYGYYTRSVDNVGKSGDFYTSPRVGTVFGEMLAQSMARWATTFSRDSWSVVEFGGGDGKLARDILQALASIETDRTLNAYTIVEASADCRKRGKRRLDDERVRWVSRFERKLIRSPVVVIANEFVDALPVHRLRFSSGGWKEIYVTWNDEKQAFAEILAPYEAEAVKAYIEEERPPEVEGYTVEVNVTAREWLKQLAEAIDEGFVLIIDYGYDKGNLWRPERRAGTLMCYYRHRAHENPYVLIGEQDLTTHVNFSSLKRWGEQFGFREVCWLTQGEFLKKEGILERLVAHTDPNPFSEVAKRNRAIRQLVAPEGMGGVFKVLLLGKK